LVPNVSRSPVGSGRSREHRSTSTGKLSPLS
jgi:hypothetical protein